MLDPQRLLGTLLSGTVSEGRGSSLGVTAGLGLLGVAIAAYEHFTQASARAPATGAAPARTMPPTAPGAGPPPPPVAPPPVDPVLVLMRAMIAAANADGHIDVKERARIHDRLAQAGLDAEERGLLERELDAPLGIEALARAASTPALAGQVYTASLLAIEVDTPAERDYLARLGKALGLDADTIASIHRQVSA